jgi:integrase
MRTKLIIGARLLASKDAQPGAKPFEISDARLPGFILRVQPSGVRSYYAQIGRGRRVALAKVGELTPEEAREHCTKVLGNVAHGREPLFGLDGAAQGATLGEFITASYVPWVRERHPRSAEKHLKRLRRYFGKWFNRTLAEITVADVEGWRLARASEVSAATARRDLNPMASVLTRAVKLGLIRENVVRRIERPKIDHNPKVRYLTSAEETRLRAELDARDAKMRTARDSANAWRRARDRTLMPALPRFGDHLTPAVLVSINTGVRLGELLSLRWSAVDFSTPQLTVEGATEKTGQTRHVPLNREAVDVLKAWKKQAPDTERVFPIETGFRKAWVAVLERAKVTGFRWHDLRHHFASRLVQSGVPINTVRELLGHASLAMTLRYAHLAPDQKRAAVAMLMEARA